MKETSVIYKILVFRKSLGIVQHDRNTISSHVKFDFPCFIPVSIKNLSKYSLAETKVKLKDKTVLIFFYEIFNEMKNKNKRTCEKVKTLQLKILIEVTDNDIFMVDNKRNGTP